RDQPPADSRAAVALTGGPVPAAALLADGPAVVRHLHLGRSAGRGHPLPAADDHRHRSARATGARTTPRSACSTPASVIGTKRSASGAISTRPCSSWSVARTNTTQIGASRKSCLSPDGALLNQASANNGVRHSPPVR